MSTRSVSVKVNIGATGDLAAKLAETRAQIRQLSAVGAATGGGGFMAKHSWAPTLKREISGASDLARSRLADRSFSAREQVVDRNAERDLMGTAAHRSAMGTEAEAGLGGRLNSALEKQAQAAAQGELIGTQQHTRTIIEEVKARKQATEVAKAELRVRNIAEFGKFGAGLREANEALAKMSSGPGLLMGGGLMASTVASASPDVFRNLTSSVQIAAGSIGQMFVPAVASAIRMLQNATSAIEAIPQPIKDLVGSIGGAVLAFGAATWAGEKLSGVAVWLQSSFAKVAGTGDAAAAALAKVAATGNAASAANAAGAGGGLLGKAGGVLLPAAGAFAMSGWGESMGSKIGAPGSTASKVGGVLGSTATGAAAGAAIGSIIPGIGTAIGGAIGGLVGFVKSAFKSTEKKKSEEREVLTHGMNFTNRQMSIEGIHDVIQSEAIKDPLEQKKFEQNIAAMNKLVESLGGLDATLRRHRLGGEYTGAS